MAVLTEGNNTTVGDIADKLKRPDAPTEFEKNLSDFSIFISKTTLALVLAVLLIKIFIFRGDFFQVFIFAIVDRGGAYARIITAHRDE